MKSAVLASVLLSSLAIAAPVDKRAVNTVWHTDMVTVTAVITVAPGASGAAQQPTAVPNAAVPTPSATTPSTALASPASSASAAAAGGAGIGSIYQAVPTVTAVGNLPPPVPPAVGNSYQGDGTIYNGVGDPGSCGLGPLIDTDIFAAVPHGMIGDYPTVNKGMGMPESRWCGVTVEISYQGKTALAPVKDTCQGCVPGDIDTSPALFSYLTNGQTTGRLPFSWKIVATSPYF